VLVGGQPDTDQDRGTGLGPDRPAQAHLDEPAGTGPLQHLVDPVAPEQLVRGRRDGDLGEVDLLERLRLEQREVVEQLEDRVDADVGLGREAVGAGQGEGPAAPLLVQRAGDPAQVGHLERPEEVVGLDVQGVGGVGA
jgi:hypothetical protein